MEEVWDLVLWQESLAPGVEEVQGLDFGEDGGASSAVRGHSVFVSTSATAMALHRKWASAIQAVFSGESFVGLVLSADPDARGVAIASVHMPSSWNDDEVFMGSLELLDRFVEKVGAGGGGGGSAEAHRGWRLEHRCGFLNEQG